MQNIKIFILAIIAIASPAFAGSKTSKSAYERIKVLFYSTLPPAGGNDVSHSSPPSREGELATAIKTHFDGFIINKFLPVMDDIMTSDALGTYKDVLGVSLYRAIRTDKEAQVKLHYMIEKAERFSQAPLPWASKSPKKRTLEFVKKYRFKRDFSILAHQLQGADGILQRGPFNSFIDVAIDSFTPAQNKPTGGSWTPDTFKSENPHHAKTYLISQLFLHMAAVKGLLFQVEKLNKAEISPSVMMAPLREQLEICQLLLEELLPQVSPIHGEALSVVADEILFGLAIVGEGCWGSL